MVETYFGSLDPLLNQKEKDHASYPSTTFESYLSINKD
jgi:hypothetical protein